MQIVRTDSAKVYMLADLEGETDGNEGVEVGHAVI